jgi:putative oxidoreductase
MLIIIRALLSPRRIIKSTAATNAIIVLTRIVLGYGGLQHGLAKVLNGPEHFAASLAGLGVFAPAVMSWATIATELICGAAIILGVLTRLMCLPIVIILLVALFTVHLPFGFSSIKLQAVTSEGIKFGPPGYEVILLYLVCITTLFLLGSGPLSVDAWRVKRSKEDPA